MSFKTLQIVIMGNSTPLQTALRAASTDVAKFNSQVISGNTAVEKSAIGASNAMKGLGIGIAAGLVAGVSMAVQLDKAMANVNSISYMTAAQLKTTTQVVVDMSTHTTQSAVTLAKGLYDIASSGFQGSAGLTVLKASAIAATAGLSTTATAAQAITAVLNAYGEGAGQAKEVSDVLFQTVNLGVITFDQLAQSIGNTIGVASTAKISIGEVGAAIAAMTLTGLDGAEATTSLNRVIQSILVPSAALEVQLKSLGYQSGAQALQVDGLYKVMMKLQQATGGNVTSLISLFPDIRSVRGAFALMAADGANYTKTQEGIANAQNVSGATGRAFAEQMKSVANQFDLLKNKASAIAIETGQDLLPALLGLEKVFTDILPPIKDVLTVGATIIRWLTDTKVGVALLGGVLAAILIPRLIDTALNIAAILALAGFQWFAKLAQGVDGASLSFKGLAGSEAVATLGLTALAAEIIHVIDHWNEASKAAQKTADTITAAADPTSAKTLADANAAYAKSMGQLVTGANAANAALDKMYKNDGTGGFVTGLNAGVAQIIGIGNKANTASAQYDKLSAAAKTLYAQHMALTTAVHQAAVALGVSDAAAFKLAQTNGVDLTGSVTDVSNAIQTAYAKTVLGSTGVLALNDASETLSSGIATATDKVTALSDALNALIGINVDADQAFDNYRGSLDNLATSLAASKGKLSDFTSAGRDSKAALRDSITDIDDYITALQKQGASSDQLTAAFNNQVSGLVATMVQAGYTTAQVNQLLTSYGLVPSQVTTYLSQAGANDATTQVGGLNTALSDVPGQTTANVSVTGASAAVSDVDAVTNAILAMPTQRSIMITTLQADVQLGTISAQAAKNIEQDPDFNETYSNQPITTSITHANVDNGPGTVESKAGQAAAIDQSSPAGVVAPPSATAAKDAATAAQQKQDAADAAAELKRQIARNTKLAVLPTSFDPSTIYSNLSSALDTQAKAVAQAKADLSANKSDTADDYYKAPVVSLQAYKNALDTSVKAQQQWQVNLSKIAKYASSDVVTQLKNMGEQGVDLVAKMAAGTKTQIIAMSNTLMSLGPTTKQAMSDFESALHLDVGAQQTFQNNLTTLIAGGHVALAADLAGQGYETAGDIAAQAVKASPTELAGIEADENKKSALATGQDLTDLTTMMTKITAATGVIALANLTGLSVSRELDLYNRFTATFQAGAKGKLAAWKADITAIANGRQPVGADPTSNVNGYASGTIIPSGKTGEYYRWAEPSSGGESLIPHGAAHRARALQLWQQTGKILGVDSYSMPTARVRAGSFSGGGQMTMHIAAGAVHAPINISGDGSATAEQVQASVEGAISSAFDKLTERITSGTGRNT